MASIKKYRRRLEEATQGRRERDAIALLLDADVHFHKWELDKAVTAAEKAARLFRELDDQAAAADALTLQIRSLGSQEQVWEADARARSELAMFRSLNEPIGQAKMLLVQSEICWNQEDRQEEAVSLAREALALFEQESHAHGQAQAWMAVAESQMAAGKCKTVAHPARKAARLFRAAGEEREELRALLLASQATISVLTKGARESTWAAWEESLNAVEATLKRLRALGDDSLEANALCQLAEVHNMTGSYEEALKASQEAAKIYRDLGDEADAQDIAGALHWTVDTHVKCERYKEARATVEEIRQLGLERGDASLETLANDLLESIAAPATVPQAEAAKSKEEPPEEPEGPGQLVRNQQGDVMDVRTGLAFRPALMQPSRLAELLEKVLEDYHREELECESLPLMQAGIAGPISVELQTEWWRRNGLGKLSRH